VQPRSFDTPPEDAGRYSLALAEARRALDHQANDVSGLRTRMTNLVSAGGLAAAFIGGLALRGEAPFTIVTWFGVGAFAALFLVAIWALWPRQLTFVQRADDLVQWAEEGDPLASMERDVALYTRRHYRSNAKRLDSMTRLYMCALILLLAEILLLLIDLRSR
jgi:hypothetical protein